MITSAQETLLTVLQWIIVVLTIPMAVLAILAVLSMIRLWLRGEL